MKKIITYSTLITLAIFALSGCKKLDDVNVNPNDPSTVTPSVQLTATELQIAYTFGGDVARYAGVIDQHVVGYDRQMSLTEAYVFSPSDFDQPWQNNYLSMNNLKDLHDRASKAGYNTYSGIAQVLLAYTLGMSSDIWGDIPYTEALKGFDNLTPGFDSQEKVYEEVQKLLDAAIADLGKAPGALMPGADDIVYGGDGAEWTKLAYALKARFYLHTRKRHAGDVALAQAALANAFTSSTDDAAFHFGSTARSANPWYQFFTERGSDILYYDAADGLGTVANIMVATSDDRLPFLIDTAAGQSGTSNSAPFSAISIMTYAEQKFIEAELDFVNGDHAGAAAASNAGAVASVTAVTGAAPNATWTTAYASETDVTVTLEKIMTQKYLALFLNPESWTDWRRTGFPVLSLNPGSATGEIPRRFLYPETELERNSHTPSGVQVTDRVWWDMP